MSSSKSDESDKNTMKSGARHESKSSENEKEFVDQLVFDDGKNKKMAEYSHEGNQKMNNYANIPVSRQPTLTIEDTDGVPEGWKRKISQRMTGKSAGKFDVYIFSPEGKKFRSRPELVAHLEETKLGYTIDNFSFKYKPSPGSMMKTPKIIPTVKARKRPLLAKTEQAKPKRKRTKLTNNQVPVKGPRKVLQPSVSKKDKASRSQAFQKLLVKMNFLKPGERQMTSSESESDDDFDDGMV